MIKKKKESKQPRITYSNEVEAAWYALKRFINPLDCSINVIGSVLPMNKNVELACIYSGTTLKIDGIEHKPSYFGKAQLFQHLHRISTYYYRSSCNTPYSDGYGSTDEQAQRLSFAKELNITHRVRKHETMNVLLLGIDIDAHNGERDVSKVQEWLSNQYFHHSYWEPSTGGKGRHGYVKIAFHKDSSRPFIASSIKEMFNLLDQKRIALGFDAPVDRPCGLFSTMSFRSENPYPEYEISKLNDKYIEYHRSQCLKIPRFNSSYITTYSMKDILLFHSLPYYSFKYILSILKQLQKEINPVQEEPNKCSEEVPLTRVCTPQADIKTEKDHEGVVDLSDYWQKKENRHNTKQYYNKRIEECRLIQDTLEKTRKFYWHYALYSKTVPSVEDAITEYIKQNLNTNSNISSKKRYDRFVSCRQFIVERFDLSKSGFRVDDWDAVKHGYIGQISNTIEPEELYWKKDNRKKCKLKYEELALVYYAIKKSGEYDRGNKDKIIKNSFSYKMIQQLFRVTYNSSCHRTKASRIITILKDAGMIVKIGNYIPGVRGNCYVVAEVYQLFKETEIADEWLKESMEEFIASLCA